MRPSPRWQCYRHVRTERTTASGTVISDVTLTRIGAVFQATDLRHAQRLAADCFYELSLNGDLVVEPVPEMPGT